MIEPLFRAVPRVALVMLVVAAIFLSARPSSAAQRVALLIGNSDYGDNRLPSVENDLKLVGETLTGLGFDVTNKTNLDVKQMSEAVSDFARLTPSRCVAVIYFAGFGGQDRDKNFVQGAGQPRKLAKDNAVWLQDLRNTIRDNSGARHTLLILDAAQPNPMIDEKDRAKGFTTWKDGEDRDRQIVLFAAKPGTTAPPMSANNSPLALAVAKHLQQAEKSLPAALDAIVAEVNQQTGGKQQPAFVLTQNKAEKIAWNQQHDWQTAEGLEVREGKSAGEHWANSLGMVFCWIPSGKFTMGSYQPKNEDAPRREVEISDGFWMAKYEFTQRDLKTVRGRDPDAREIYRHDNAPLTWQNWRNAVGLAKMVTDQERKAGHLSADWEYALPSEAQWEYACRAGSQTRYHFGDSENDLGQYANFADAALYEQDDSYYWASRDIRDGIGRRTAVVGSFRPNAWGLHDMHGNVAEWCTDSYVVGPITEDQKDVDRRTLGKVHRGGAWCSTPENCAAGFRNYGSDKISNEFAGLRLVLRKKN